MTSGGRASIAAATVLAFFLLWGGIAAHPWVTARQRHPDPRLEELARRERELKKRAAYVNRVVDRRWTAYRAALARRQLAIAAVQAKHLRDLEAAYASAIAAACAANAQAAAARLPVAAASASPPARSPAAPVTGSTAAPAPAPAASAPPPVAVAPPATPPATTTTSSHP